MPETTTLKPCPFCGGNDLELKDCTEVIQICVEGPCPDDEWEDGEQDG